jgi:tRNA-2-methylthio-N6-dimethylallyladenosine synthase
MKKIFVKTFGCQMNVRDSEVICGLLKKDGFILVDLPEKADIIIFNTCSVRQHAEDRVFSLIGEYRKRRNRGESLPRRQAGPVGAVPLIGIIGCMAKNHQEKIFDKSPEVDFVVGPSDIDKIPGIVKSLMKNKGESLPCRQAGPAGTVPCGDSPLFARKIWETDGESRPEEIYHTGFYEGKNHAHLVISEGCSNFCSYCVVPFVRGPLRHRNFKDILKELEVALGKGISEITLLGQNVNAYSYEGVDFVGLLKLVNSAKRLKAFDFMTSHPKDASPKLFKAIAGLEKLKKSLHLPIQSGSDRILGLMNRGYSRKFYLDLVDKYRKIVSGGVITTDIIVGFPTETEADFKDTYDLLKSVGFNSAYIFKYSPRPNTQAVKMDDDIGKKEKERRHALILDLQRKVSKKKR